MVFVKKHSKSSVDHIHSEFCKQQMFELINKIFRKKRADVQLYYMRNTSVGVVLILINKNYIKNKVTGHVFKNSLCQDVLY